MYMYMHEINFNSHQYFPGVCRLQFRGGGGDTCMICLLKVSVLLVQRITKMYSIQNLNEYHHTFKF